jgi:putative hemolysin
MNNIHTVAGIIILICLLVLSAFFSASETTFLLLSRIAVRQMLNEKAKHAVLIQKLKTNMSGLLSAVLVGNNIVNTAASAIATAIAIALAGNYGAGIAACVMTCAIIIFSEIIPKTIAAENPVNLAKKIAPLLYFFILITAPLTFIFRAYSALIHRCTKKTMGSTPLFTEDELKTLIKVGRDEGTIAPYEQKMLLNVFEFTDLHVTAAARHRSLVKSVPATASYRELLDTFIKSGYSRLLVHEDENDNYIGLIHYKDVLFGSRNTELRGARGNDFILSHMRAVRFVPGTMSCASLLQIFKKEKINMAIVVNEHGGNIGIITMDDILNAVMGKLYDEYDYSEHTPAERITIISDTEFLVPGEIKLGDFNEIFSESLESEYYDTLAGFLLEAFDSLPSAGETIKRGDTLFEIEDQIRHRICTVRVRKC